MPSIASWLGTAPDLEALPTATVQQRAALAYRRILDKPTTVVLKTSAGVNRASQTVRIDSDNSASPAESAAGAAPKRKVVILGVKGHATLADTIIQEGDRFVHENDSYRVVDVIRSLIGEIQAVAEATG